MSEELKLPREWEIIDGIKVIDPDGWNHGLGLRSWGEPISREEWERRIATSTCDFRESNLNAIREEIALNSETWKLK